MILKRPLFRNTSRHEQFFLKFPTHLPQCDKDRAGTGAYITVRVYNWYGRSTSFGVDGDPLPFSRGDVANVYGKHFGSVLDVDKIKLTHNGAGKSSGWAPDELSFYSKATACSMFLVS